MTKPTLVVVSGPPGSGKTTLAHALARAIPCPAICRDEIKEGIAFTYPGFQPAPGDWITQRTFALFFDLVEMLLRAEVSLVAEAAFQNSRWEPKLATFVELADVTVIRCQVDPEIAQDRILSRIDGSPRLRAAHSDAHFLKNVQDGSWSLDRFDDIQLDAPRLVVDTAEGYDPTLDDIVAFVDQSRSAPR